MKPKPYYSLQHRLLSPGAGYFPRKKEGQLCVVADTESGLVYPVPIKIEHVDFVSKILGYHITENIESASKIVPSNILLKVAGINDVVDEVRKVLTGVSGMESGYGLRHDLKQLTIAEDIVLNFIKKGELPLADDFNAKIETRYMKK